MRKNGHENLEVKNCGFIIHPTQGWLGASPDGLVHDAASHDPSGILEIKCPCTKRDVSPEKACQDRDFHCTGMRRFETACWNGSTEYWFTV